MQSIVQHICEVSSEYRKPDGFTPSYGTAGFRSKAELLTSTVFRCAAFTSLPACPC